MSNPTKYCWDTSVFLAWLNEETSAPLRDIDVVVGEIDSGKATLIVSVTTYSEILETKHTKEQLNKLDLFLKRSNVMIADVTVPIAQEASRIRSAAHSQKRNIKTPDATIMATAILYEADVLHSLDPHHLNLSGSDIVNRLKIIEPI